MEETPPSAPSPPPFGFARESASFTARWMEEIARRSYEQLTNVVSPENMLKYAHGKRWSILTTQGVESVGEFKLQSAMTSSSADDRRKADMADLNHQMSNLTEQLGAGAMAGLEQTASEVAKSGGNVVSWGKLLEDPGAAFISMLRKIEFGIDENGEPTLPEFHNFPAQVLARLHERTTSDPAFEAEVEKIKADKIAAARQREAERKAKFVRRP